MNANNRIMKDLQEIEREESFVPVVEAHWVQTGDLSCVGEWRLSVGADVSHLIPEEKRYDAMLTLVDYEWGLSDDEYLEDEGYCRLMEEEWKEEWLEGNDSWLSAITDNPALKEAIFEAIQLEDWPHCEGPCLRRWEELLPYMNEACL